MRAGTLRGEALGGFHTHERISLEDLDKKYAYFLKNEA